VCPLTKLCSRSRLICAGTILFASAAKLAYLAQAKRPAGVALGSYDLGSLVKIMYVALHLGAYVELRRASRPGQPVAVRAAAVSAWWAAELDGSDDGKEWATAMADAAAAKSSGRRPLPAPQARAAQVRCTGTGTGTCRGSCSSCICSRAGAGCCCCGSRARCRCCCRCCCGSCRCSSRARPSPSLLPLQDRPMQGPPPVLLRGCR